MSVTKDFYDAVANNKIMRVRIMMKNSLSFDSSLKDFEEMEKITQAMPGLYDEHDGKELIQDHSKWNEDYMYTQMEEVVDNFSHERINHLKEVVRYLRPYTPPKTQTTYAQSERTTVNPQPERSYQEQKRIDQKNGSYRGPKIAAGAVIGAVAGGVVASCANITVVGGVLVGAAVGGAIAAVVTMNGEKK